VSGRAPGKRQAVTISDVAAAAGVSKSMVSYALNNRPGVKPETRERILETVRQLGWTPSLRGRALSASRAFAVGLVFQKPAEALAIDQYYTSLMAGLQSVLSPAGYSLVTEVVTSVEAETAAYDALVRDGRIDGMVLTDFLDDDRRLDRLVEHGVSAVSLGRPERAHEMPVLVSSEKTAIADAVDHLMSAGHRRIAQVSGPQRIVAARARRVGYQECLRHNGLDDGLWVEGDFTAESGYRLTSELLARPERPTAVVYGDDLMAIAGMTSAIDAGLGVPDELSIVGWGDIAVAEYLRPSLSTIVADPFGDGAAAASVLLEAIEGRRFAQPIRVPDPSFVRRSSSGLAPPSPREARVPAPRPAPAP
jgi:DNA-binding LacI/PurR family transcriptional regulator